MNQHFPSKLRRQICYEAARAIYLRHESEYCRAKRKAAQRICKGAIRPTDLPSDTEIREEILILARLHEDACRDDHLLQMRLTALRIMRLLHRFRPKLIGSTCIGNALQVSEIDIHLFSDSLDAIAGRLDEMMLFYEIERTEAGQDGERRVYTHFHLKDQFPVELTVFPAKMASHVFHSSITGQVIERASIAELEQFFEGEYPQINLVNRIQKLSESLDRFQLYTALLLPLENVKQHPKQHPEGDVLYHSLQVFELAYDELPYDEEFLLAALLHDVGKGIDVKDHVAAGLEALEGFISPRTHWLIEHHAEAQRIFDGTIGVRAHRRLRENESYHELLALNRCDRAGRVPGVATQQLEDVIETIRQLSYQWDS